MTTQISNLINGSEFTVRNLSASKYQHNPIGFSFGKGNVPALGGTTRNERNRVAALVAAEHPSVMNVIANGVELQLNRYNSKSGKSWRWECEITAEQFTQIVGRQAPSWTHKGAVNVYNFVVYMDCTVYVLASSGKKGDTYILGEEFVQIL